MKKNEQKKDDLQLPDWMEADEDFHELPPVPKLLILKYNGEKPNGYLAPTWSQIADEAGLTADQPDPRKRGHNALCSWRNFLNTPRGQRCAAKMARLRLEVRGQTIDQHGKVRSEKLAMPQEDNRPDNQEGAQVTGWTENPFGKGAWVRYKVDTPPEDWMTPEELERFTKNRDAFDLSKEHRHLTFESKGQGNFENWLVLGCVHVPYHNRYLWEGVLQLIEKQKIDGIILAGDFLDLKSLGSYDKGQVRDVNLWDEYMAGFQAIEEVEQALSPEARKVYIYGNHEDRFWRVMKDAENNRFGSALLTPHDGMKLEEKGWQVLTNWKEDYVMLGNSLEVFHGQYLGKGACKKHLDASAAVNRSCLFFHTHAKDFSSNGTFTSWNGGFLGDLESEGFKYASRHTRQAWENGFAFVTIDNKGGHHVSLASCQQKSFILNGSQYPNK